MLDGIKDLFKDVSFSVDQRIRNPYWFSFLVLIIYYNWEGLLVLININDFKSINEKQQAINAIKFYIWLPVIFAFVGVLVFYIVQYLGLTISIFFQDRLKPNLLAVISSKRFASVEKVKGLREMITNLSTEKSDLENELSRFQSKSKILTDEYIVKLGDLEKEKLLKEKELSDLKYRFSKQEDENKVLNDKVIKLKSELDRLRRTNINLEYSNNMSRSGINTVKQKQKWNSLNDSIKVKIQKKYNQKFKSDIDNFLTSFVKKELESSNSFIKSDNYDISIKKENEKNFIATLKHHITQFFFNSTDEFKYDILFISRDNLTSLIDQYFSSVFLDENFMNVGLVIQQDLYNKFHSGIVSLVNDFSREITDYINR